MRITRGTIEATKEKKTPQSRVINVSRTCQKHVRPPGESFILENDSVSNFSIFFSSIRCCNFFYSSHIILCGRYILPGIHVMYSYHIFELTYSSNAHSDFSDDPVIYYKKTNDNLKYIKTADVR